MSVAVAASKKSELFQLSQEMFCASPGWLKINKPNAAAHELGGKRSRVVGLIYENAQEFSHVNHLFNGAPRICEPAGRTLLLRPLTLPDPEIIEHYCKARPV